METFYIFFTHVAWKFYGIFHMEFLGVPQKFHVFISQWKFHKVTLKPLFCRIAAACILMLYVHLLSLVNCVAESREQKFWQNQWCFWTAAGLWQSGYWMYSSQQQQRPINGPLSRTTRVSRYLVPYLFGYFPMSLINFLHLLWSIASSLSLESRWVQQSFSTVSLQVLFGIPLGLTLHWY